MRGNISGRQDLTYTPQGGDAYSVPDDEKAAASGYSPRVVAKVLRYGYRNALKYFQVRTRSSVNMTGSMRATLALMGGSGALYAAIVRDKTSAIYTSCVAACPSDKTLRAFLIPIIRAGLSAKDERITITTGLYIVNPWTSSEPPTVNISAEILDKFSSVLSNS